MSFRPIPLAQYAWFFGWGCLETRTASCHPQVWEAITLGPKVASSCDQAQFANLGILSYWKFDWPVCRCGRIFPEGSWFCKYRCLAFSACPWWNLRASLPCGKILGSSRFCESPPSDFSCWQRAMVGQETRYLTCNIFACSRLDSSLLSARPTSGYIRINKSSASCLWRRWDHQLGRSWGCTLSKRSYGACFRFRSRTSRRCICGRVI